MYIGDSIRSDIFPAKTFSKWDTVLILEELESERHQTDNSSNNGKEAECGQDQGQPARKKKKVSVHVSIYILCLRGS